MNAAILLVGEYPALLSTRAALLRKWHVVATDPKDAIDAASSDMLMTC